MIKRFPNQKRFTISREMPKSNSGKQYLAAYNENILLAMQELSASCFKVYMYLIMNKNGYEFDFSPAYISEEIGLHKDTIRKCLYELEAKRYIRPIGKSGFEYEFKETPFQPIPSEWLHTTSENSQTGITKIIPKVKPSKISVAEPYNFDDWDV